MRVVLGIVGGFAVGVCVGWWIRKVWEGMQYGLASVMHARGGGDPPSQTESGPESGKRP